MLLLMLYSFFHLAENLVGKAELEFLNLSYMGGGLKATVQSLRKMARTGIFSTPPPPARSSKIPALAGSVVGVSGGTKLSKVLAAYDKELSLSHSLLVFFYNF